MTHTRLISPVLFAALALGCGGDPSKRTDSDPADRTGDLDTGRGDNPIAANPCGQAPDANPCAANPCADPAQPPEREGPAVTFEFKNTWTEDLVFNLDAGWGLVVQVYSGEPPDAVAVEPWPRYCTAGCETEGDEKCPVCKKPERISKIREAEKRQVIKPSESFELEWEGEVHNYEKVKRNCQCYTTAPVPDETYTVRACGLRLSKKHKRRSKLQCVVREEALTFPSDEPQRVVFDFGDPKKKKTTKK